MRYSDELKDKITDGSKEEKELLEKVGFGMFMTIKRTKQFKEDNPEMFEEDEKIYNKLKNTKPIQEESRDEQWNDVFTDTEDEYMYNLLMGKEEEYK